MPSTFTSRNRLEKQAAGENNNTWGARLNDNVIEMVDEATDGVTSFTLSGSRSLTVNEAASDESRRRAIHVTGGTGGTIIVPNVEKNYLVRNASTGNVVITTGSGTTAAVPAGSMIWVISTGANACYAQVYSNFGAEPISTTGAGTFGSLSVSGAAAFAGAADFATYMRVQGNIWPVSGSGLEMRYSNSFNTGYLEAYDRSTASYKNIIVSGLSISLNVAGTSYLVLSSSGHLFGNMASTAISANVARDGSGYLKQVTSSEVYKDDIRNVSKEEALASLTLVPIRYRSKCAGDDPAWSWFGHSAERVAAVNPRFAHWGYHDFQYEEVEKKAPARIETGRKDRRGESVLEDGQETIRERHVKDGEALQPISAQYDRIATVQIYGLILEIQALKERIAALEAA